MRGLRHIAAGLLMAVLLGLPAMACLAPESQLTPAEHACCRRMARQCGAMSRMQSHSCCRTDIRSAAPFVTTQRVATAMSLTTPTAPATAASPELPPTVASWQVAASAHSPPAPPGSTTILRI